MPLAGSRLGCPSALAPLCSSRNMVQLLPVLCQGPLGPEAEQQPLPASPAFFSAPLRLSHTCKRLCNVHALLYLFRNFFLLPSKPGRFCKRVVSLDLSASAVPYATKIPTFDPFFPALRAAFSSFFFCKLSFLFFTLAASSFSSVRLRSALCGGQYLPES